MNTTLVFVIAFIAFALGYAAGWDGKYVSDEIKRRKIDNPDGWWKE